MRALILVWVAALLTACVPAMPTVPAPVQAPVPERLEPVSEAGEPPPEGEAVQQGIAAAAATSSAAEVHDPADGEVPSTGPSAAAAEAAGPSAATAGGPSWDIAVTPYETHERVEHYVARYTGPARSWVTERLARGTRYETMIREKLRAGGLPGDMYYLAFVESGFDTHAYSRAAAVGMWQFMAPTAKWMNLRVDWWVDERMDPVRATDAAVRFLSSLKNQFGSLYLAAAAYNGGPGRVSRGLTRLASAPEPSEGEDRFFALSEQRFLPPETREYVPQIIAAALVGNAPSRYGIEIERREAFAYDSVDVPALTSLPVIARAAGTDMTVLRELNPQFIRAITPPRGKSQVRIPRGSRALFDSAFALIPEAERLGVRRERLTESGSLASVARAFGTTPRGITAFNPNLRRTPKRNVAAGQTLFIATAAVAAAAADIPDPSVGRSGSTKAKRSHTVENGETLGHIALQYGTTVKTLMRLNGLKRPLIRVGQKLVVGG